ncbi:MAG: hypothetical protein ACSW8G_04430 [Bacillota bacterium]
METKNMCNKIKKIDFYSKATLDIHYENKPKIVRMEGDLCTDYFVAFPDTMIWVDPPEDWAWPPDRNGPNLTESERGQVMSDVKEFLKKQKYKVVFETKELMDIACELASEVHDKKMSMWTAKRTLKKAFPDVPKGVIGDVLGRAYFYTR